MCMFGLCDCNNFFVSCERVFNPSLNGKPVVVLSNNDGCIIARSNEAKALGIKMGQPLYQVQRVIDNAGVSYMSSNYHLYGDMSQRVFTTLKQIAPYVEIYSIDEAFIDFSGVEVERLQEIGREMVRTVKRNTGIPVSIGIAPTKTLAKVASRLCKQYPKLEGCCVMTREEDIKKVLSRFPIGDIWGIGRKYRKMLTTFGVETTEDFRQLSPEWVKDKMSIVGLRTWQELHGKPCVEFEHSTTDRKSIMISRTFAKELNDKEALREQLTTYTVMAAEKLRKQGSLAGELQVFIYTNRHREDKPQHREGMLLRLPNYTDDTLELIKYMSGALNELYRSGFDYKRAGVVLHDIVSKKSLSHNLFAEEDSKDNIKSKELMQALDNINKKHGRGAVMIGLQSKGINSRRERLSPQYTTEWDDILVVKV